MVASEPSARQRKLVEDGAKGVAGRWLGDSRQAAEDGVRMRSAVKRFSGKPDQKIDQKAEPAAAPQARARKRTTRAEQAAAGMMGPPPTTFDEAAIKSWLATMSAEDLAKLAKLTAIAKAGKENGRGAWNKVDRGIAERGMHVEVHGGTVTINNTQPAPTPYPSGARPRASSSYNGGSSYYNNWGRHLARIKNFING